jgi:hypothetical protein
MKDTKASKAKVMMIPAWFGRHFGYWLLQHQTLDKESAFKLASDWEAAACDLRALGEFNDMVKPTLPHVIRVKQPVWN